MRKKKVEGEEETAHTLSLSVSFSSFRLAAAFRGLCLSVYSGALTYECPYFQTFLLTNSSDCNILLRLANRASTYEQKKGRGKKAGNSDF